MLTDLPLVERFEVLGPSEVWPYPRLEAEERDWAAALSGEFREEGRQACQGERARPDKAAGP